MNVSTRSAIIMVCFGFCTGGLIAISLQNSIRKAEPTDSFSRFSLAGRYQFAASDLHEFNFAQLEEIIRADVFSKFPSARVEFGSVKVEHGMLSMPVVLFGPNHQSQAFLYRLVPHKNSWKITGSQRLWFVPPSQILRGLRV